MSFDNISVKNAQNSLQEDQAIKKSLIATVTETGGASPEKVGWKSDRIDGQKVYLTILMSFLVGNGYRPEESGVDITPVHPVAPL